MTQPDQKVIQYLAEAHATELALTRVLQAQIAMAPRGQYRRILETHLRETNSHAKRVQERLRDVGESSNPIEAGLHLLQTAIGQGIALAKTPLDLVRGSGGEEKVLKNAKDACATEALEIATYTALEKLAASVGDTETAKLAASILEDERKTLDAILKEIPGLTEDVVRAEIDGKPQYDIAETGAADTARSTAKDAKRSADKSVAKVKRTSRQARKVPGVAKAEGLVKGAVASAEDLPIAGYDNRSADEITARLSELSQVDLAKVQAYERRHDNRTTVTSRIDSLRGSEPWAGYDELNVGEIKSSLSTADEKLAKNVREYERRHKDRAGVIEATERETATA